MSKSYRLDWAGPRAGNTTMLYHSGFILSDAPAETGFQTSEEYMHVWGQYDARCISYFYCRENPAAKVALDYLLSKGVRIFLDSGAFTLQRDPHCSWKVTEAYADEYCAFLHTYRNQLDWFAGLDWRRDADTTKKAQKLMHKRGHYPVPVYHGNDPFRELEEYFDQGCRLVAIAKPGSPGSTMEFLSNNALRRYYDGCFELAAKHGALLHGLAQTGKLMFDYPWYSVDSSSWLFGGRTGKLLYITNKGYLRNFDFSVRFIHMKEIPANKLRAWGREQLAKVPKEHIAMVEERCKLWGFDVLDLLLSYHLRNSYNARVLAESLANKPHTGRRVHQGIL